MSTSAPAPPDPTATANAQEGLNKETAQTQAELNMVNQTTPYGSMTYNQTGTAPDGTPTYTSTQTLNPAEQKLFNTYVGTQQGLGKDAGALMKNLGSSLTNAPNLDPSTLTNQMMQWGQQYMQPIFNQQQSNLDSQLQAQGITQGSQAYGNAQNLQARNVDNAYENLFMQAEPMAYSQALSSYQAPIQTLGTLLGESQPGSVSQNLTQTPSEQIQPADIQSLTEQNYAQQNANYENTMSGLFSIPSAVLGGWARMGFATPSDIRIKENITKVGQLDNGLPVYIFNYKTDPDGIPQIGLMAQDVEKIAPDAVTEINGVKHIYYERLKDYNGPNFTKH